MIKSKFKDLYVYLYFLLLSSVTLAIISQASYLYPVIDWVDPNCLYTMGKAMMNGKVLYRDVFDHKGPYTYFYFGFAYLLTKDSYVGLYLLQIVLSFIFAIFTKKTLELYGIKDLKKNLIICTVIHLSTYYSFAVSVGNSVEEIAMPFLAISLYISLKRIKNEQNLKFSDFIFMGLIGGFLFWIKFTLLAFFVGWFIYFFVVYIKQKSGKDILKMIFGILLGVVIITIPCIIYFAVNNALYDLYEVYFYDNLFVYTGRDSKNFFYAIGSGLGGICLALLNNFQISIPAIFGIVVFFKKKLKERFLLLATFISFLILSYVFATWYRYYAVPMSIFAVFGYVALFQIDFKKKFKPDSRKKAKTISITLASIALCFSCCLAFFRNGNQYYLLKKKEDTAQFKFAEIINNSDIENPKLLNYGFLDGGFYYALKQTPSFKYFCTTNCKIDEMEKESKKYIEEKQADFIVIKIWKNYKEELTSSNYTEVSKVKQYYRGEYVTYILYQVVKN